MGTWTFGRKIAAGFAMTVLLAIAISAIAITGLRTVIAGKDRVIASNAQALIDAERLEGAAEGEVEQLRDYLLTGDDQHVERMLAARRVVRTLLQGMHGRNHGAEGERLLREIERTFDLQIAAADRIVAQRRGSASLETVTANFRKEVLPHLEGLRETQDAFVAAQTAELETAKAASSAEGTRAVTLLSIVTLVALALAAALSWFLTRSLTKEVGSAVQHVQSSSQELQAAASQQASASTEQAAAMVEIMTTIKELLATSRQIAESAQRVAHIADETTSAARSGDVTVQKAQEGLAGIKRQVDLIVTHMLELGKKSQQIGGILEIINELAEQTNILAINATIEAAGAGETGRRFAVVADEIRKLADRVGGSTKDIRVLIDEVRAAVNTTVMVTEAGTKAVDAGARQFVDVASSLDKIVGMVGTTTDATREIELSTKQQATAVEQVNVAASNVAQAAKETETCSTQTFQTASELATLSRKLSRLVQTQAA